MKTYTAEIVHRIQFEANDDETYDNLVRAAITEHTNQWMNKYRGDKDCYGNPAPCKIKFETHLVFPS